MYSNVSVANLSDTQSTPLPYTDNALDGVVCAGVLSYITDCGALFSEWVRVTKPGGVVVFTQAEELWGLDGSQQAATELEQAGHWTRAYESAPVSYLPLHPEPTERAKLIHYLAYRIL